MVRQQLWKVSRGFAVVLVLTTACNKPKDQAAPQTTGNAGEDFTPADVKFMQGMIGHHSQALVMAAMAPSHGASDRVLLFCKKIDQSQTAEIDAMISWLKEHGQTAPNPKDTAMMSMPGMMMPGMLTAAQMKELDASKGAVFDSLFLTFMIQHHRGAVTMVADLFATPGAGQTSEIFQFASGVDADQRGEIGVMEGMLASAKGSHSQ